MNPKQIIHVILFALAASVSNVSTAAIDKNIDTLTEQANDLALARSKVKEKCQDCYEVEKLVSSYLNETCHTEQSWNKSKDVMINNSMYTYLLGLKSHGVYENVYEVTIKSARFTVDCEDSMNWVRKTKDLSVYYLM